jgi:hypothetical protein
MALLFIIGIILTVALILRIQTDMRHVTRTNRRNQALIDDAKRRANKQWTIVTTLERRAETLYPFLDNAYEQSSKLDVIVIIKRTAGTRAAATLRAYAKQRKRSIVIITHKAGMKPVSVAQKYAKGSFVMVMRPTDMLTRRSIENLSIEFAAAPDVDGLHVRSYVPTTRTLLSGFVASVHMHYHEPLHTAYKRQALLKQNQRLQTSQLAGLMLDPLQLPITYAAALSYYARRMHLAKAYAIVVGTAIFFAALIALTDTISQTVVIAVLLVCYLFNTLTQLIELRAYTAAHIANVLILTPLYAVFTFCLATTRILTTRRR